MILRRYPRAYRLVPPISNEDRALANLRSLMNCEETYFAEKNEYAQNLSDLIEYCGPALAASDVTPVYGYLFKILKGQGANVPDGAKSYLNGEQMIYGYALLSYPQTHNVDGVHTFTSYYVGNKWKKDLGTDDPSSITLYNPDGTWTEI